jgi:hypothetical protein
MSLSIPASGSSHSITRGTRALAVVLLATAASLLTVITARSEDATAGPGIVIGGTPPPTWAPAGTDHQRCVDVIIGNERSFGCINEKLRRRVDEVNPVLNAPPFDAKSQDIKVGVVNVPGVQEQYGRNFGVSVIPYRPPPLVFSSPMGRR